MDHRARRELNPIFKALLIVAGSICLFLGVLGIILPLVPATPFLLLASACYVRSSDKLHAILLNNKYIGTYIKHFNEKKGMPLKTKWTAIILLWVSLGISIYMLGILYVQVILSIIGIGFTILISRMKTLKPDT